MVNEKLFTLIKSPIITEQTSRLGENLKQVVFKVDLSSNKREIKQAVEKLFNVEVLKVTTSVVKGKKKNLEIILLITLESRKIGRKLLLKIYLLKLLID